MELKVGFGVESDHADLGVVTAHHETVHHVLHEGQGLLKIGGSHGTGSVHYKQDVRWLYSTS